MKPDKKLLVIGLIGGFVVGLLVGMAGGNRYQLKDCGIPGYVYKVDTRTGQTWLDGGGQEVLMQPQGGSH
jgi:hypothetical protein